jgi:AhpD family alkylhydroperoxidase
MRNRIDYAKASPAGYKAFGGVYVHLQNSGLPKDLIYLVYLRASYMNGCAYCIDMHSRDLLKLGVTIESSFSFRCGVGREMYSAVASASRSPGRRP